MRRSRFVTRLACIAAVTMTFAAVARAQTNNTTPGTAITTPSIVCMGIEWPCSGDADHDATCQTEYRVKNSATWLNAQPLLRCENSDHNGFYGSIFWLTAGTEYEIRLTLTDPDGGGTTVTLDATTRTVPVMPTGGRTFHVIPGTGGGDGSSGNPFQGIAAAEAAAQGGDILLLHAGDYGLAMLTKAGTTDNPIVYKAAGDGDAIIQGMFLKNWIWIDGLLFKVGSLHLPTNDWINLGRSTALTVAEGSKASYIRVTNCRFRDFCHTMKCEGGTDWYIADNDIRGIADTTGGLQGEGIEFDGTNGIICYNVIKCTADPISYPGRNTDIYGNEIQDAYDDGVEADKGKTNVRVFNNRFTNILNNVFTFQPMGYGPWYFIRNQVVQLTGKPWKFAQAVDDRYFVAHNTFIFPKLASEYAQCLLNAVHKNNLYIAHTTEDNFLRARFPSGTEPGLPYTQAFWMTQMDYDGFDMGDKAVPILWFGTQYTSFPTFAAAIGIEPHGKIVDKDQIFTTWKAPNANLDEPPFDYTLRAGTNAAVDAGIYMANINEGFIGSAPDLGVHERGGTIPQYGPRNIIPAGDYVLTVNSGSGDGSYAEDAVVPISAEAPAIGMMFDRWTGDTQYVTNHLSASTTVTMPAANVTVAATYTVEVRYTLSVVSGTGDGSYVPGTVVSIAADPPPSGFAFSAWTGDIGSIASATSANTTITMPSQNITVTATYASVPMYTLTVSGGSGDGSYPSGTMVTITADLPPSGMMFSKWVGDTSTVINVNSSITTLTMPAASITVSSTYVDMPSGASGAFLEVNGFVCMESEHFHAKAAGSGSYSTHEWQVNTAITGDSGDCMQALPESAISSGDGTAGPFMNYNIYFTTTGIYYMHLRMPQQTGGGSDSCNVGMDGVIFQAQVSNSTGAWSWRRAANTTTITSPGLHTFGIWMREDGSINDKIILTTNVDYTLAGTDTGPVESPAAPSGDYALTVTSGSGDGYYDEGAVVTITAQAPAAGFVFDQWTGDVGNVANVNSASTTITMPAADVTVAATYAALPTYTLTVNSGSGDGDYVEGASVTITADTAPVGQKFEAWTGDVAYVTNVNSASTTVTMPAQNVTVAATYSAAVMSTLTVVSGSGDGTYAEETVVQISADAAPAGQIFDAWTGDIAYVANVNASSTTVTMPATDVTVTATYVDYTPSATIDYSQDEFQFKFKMGAATVWLYIPPTTTRVKALLLMQQNVSEQKISVHPYIRQACNRSDVAVAWCSPGFDAQFQSTPLVSHDLIQSGFGTFGATIGYPELGTVPLIAFGHSATNGYAQRAAESRPDRMLAVIATHGWDAIGKLTNTPPTFANYAGPILSMIGNRWEMGQDTDTFAALTANRGIPDLGSVGTQCDHHWMPITKIDQYGSGHFDYDDEMMSIIGMFIEKAVAARLDANGNLVAIDRTTGWIAPGMSSTPTTPITIMPYSSGSSPTRDRCNWFFDQEFAEACAAFVWGSGPWNRTYQMVWFNNSNGTPAASGGNGFPDPVPFSIVPGTNQINIWAALQDSVPPDFSADAAGDAIGHSTDATVSVEYECGPYIYTDGNGARYVKLTRGATAGYLFARHTGDATYRRAVQPARHHMGSGTTAVPIVNPGDQNPGAIITLANNSTSTEYIGYYIEHGPARIVNGYQLEILPLPANTPGQIEVQLVAYKLGQTVTGTTSVTFKVPRDLSGYQLTVVNGSGSGSYDEGAVVPITANTAPAGLAFLNWSGDTECIADLTDPTTTFTMPARDATATANYQSTYALTVNTGTGDGSYIQGQVVLINADAPTQGLQFDKWTGDTEYLADFNNASTWVTMPAKAIAVTATYEIMAGYYTLTVVSGSGSGIFEQFTDVPITADTPAPGEVFTGWIGDFVYVDDPSESTTVVHMPSSDVNVTATFAPAYTLRVNYGTGDGFYVAGTPVMIEADDAPVDQIFFEWQGDVAAIQEPRSSTTWLIMPSTNIAVTAIYKPRNGLYLLNVQSGTGGGSYEPNTAVSISADPAPVGQNFSCWTGDTQYLVDVDVPDTTVLMPASDVTVKATYAFPTQTKYTLTVTSGFGSGKYVEGDVIPVSADTPPAGMQFFCWIGDTEAVTNVLSSNTTVTMPAADVAVTASYEDPNVVRYALTVESGSGGGMYEEGEVVQISADAATAGMIFAEWTGDTASVANVLSASTTITMPGADALVTAIYAARASYVLEVNFGSGSGVYYEGDTVSVIADAPPADMDFRGWSGDTEYLSDAGSASTVLTMPAGDVSVTATYATTILRVIYPSSAGITFERGSKGIITWTAPSLDPKTVLRIELTNGAQTWVLSEKAQAGKGALAWTIGKWKSKTGQAIYPDGGNYRIHITTLGGMAEDSSDSVFGIGSVTSLEIQGPVDVSENSTAQFTCLVHFNFGDPQDYTDAKIKWQTLSKAGKMGKGGLFQANEVAQDEQCTIIAGYGKSDAYVEDSFDVTIKNR